jgi:hypothetical protein
MTPNYLIEIYSVIHAARSRAAWCVVLVPRGRYDETIATISALSDVQFSGRTVTWPETGRKFSVAYAGQEVFVPKGTPFDLFLAGWGGSSKEDAKSLIAWRESAKDFISCSDWRVGSQFLTPTSAP